MPMSANQLAALVERTDRHRRCVEPWVRRIATRVGTVVLIIVVLLWAYLLLR